MYSLVASTSRNAAARAASSAKRVHRVAVVARRAVAATSAQPAAARRPARSRPLRDTARPSPYAAHQVAEVVGEVDVVALLEPLPREVAVAAEDDLLASDTAAADRRRTARRASSGSMHVAERLAHLLARSGQDPAVAEHLPRQRQPGAHQHRRPDHAVEPGDVLADDVQVGRPPRREQRLVGAVADADA